jgi:hypothetical protein
MVMEKVLPVSVPLPTPSDPALMLKALPLIVTVAVIEEPEVQFVELAQ